MRTLWGARCGAHSEYWPKKNARLPLSISLCCKKWVYVPGCGKAVLYVGNLVVRLGGRQYSENRKSTALCVVPSFQLTGVRRPKRKEVQKHDENTDTVKTEAKTNSACTHSANVVSLCSPQGHSSSSYEGIATHTQSPSVTPLYANKQLDKTQI